MGTSARCSVDAEPTGPRDSERSAEANTPPAGCLVNLVYGVGYAIAWIVVYGLTLRGAGGLVSEYLVAPDNREGFAAFLGIGSLFLVIPFGLSVSLVVLYLSKRRWVFFVMAVVMAAGFALGAPR
jgi:hypothetical protein